MERLKKKRKRTDNQKVSELIFPLIILFSFSFFFPFRFNDAVQVLFRTIRSITVLIGFLIVSASKSLRTDKNPLKVGMLHARSLQLHLMLYFLVARFRQILLD